MLRVNLQMERLVELWRPLAWLRFRRLLSLLIRQVRTDEMHFDERLEGVWSALRLPSKVIGGNNCKAT